MLLLHYRALASTQTCYSTGAHPIAQLYQLAKPFHKYLYVDDDGPFQKIVYASSKSKPPPSATFGSGGSQYPIYNMPVVHGPSSLILSVNASIPPTANTSSCCPCIFPSHPLRTSFLQNPGLSPSGGGGGGGGSHAKTGKATMQISPIASTMKHRCLIFIFTT